MESRPKKGIRSRRDNTKAVRQIENTEVVDNFLLIDLQKSKSGVKTSP